MIRINGFHQRVRRSISDFYLKQYGFNDFFRFYALDEEVLPAFCLRYKDSSRDMDNFYWFIDDLLTMFTFDSIDGGFDNIIC